MNTNEFKAARIKKGYTQEKIAKLLKLSKSSISKKERGISPFTTNEILELTHELNLGLIEVNKIFFDSKVEFDSTGHIST